MKKTVKDSASRTQASRVERQEFRAGPGAVKLSPAVSVIRAPNPGPMTFTGTNTYIVGSHDVAIVDPGPDVASHLDRIADAVRGRAVRGVLVTHCHRDHAESAREVSRRFDAPVVGFGPLEAAMSPRMRDLERRAGPSGGEGILADFAPDIRVSDGDCIEGEGWSLGVHHTPGHLADHLCFSLGKALFSGDIAMGWATTMISPPHGDLAAFRSSLRKMLSLQAEVLFPGHGELVPDPRARLEELLDHRDAREREIVECLKSGPETVDTLVGRIYAAVDPRLHGAAARNVLAHLIDLENRGLVATDNGLRPGAVYSFLSTSS